MVRFDYFFPFFFLPLSVLGERHILRIERKKMEKNLRLLKVKFVEIKQLIPSVVYPRLVQPHMLQFEIYSIKRKVIPILMG